MATCPECHGRTDLLMVKLDRLVKKCVECGHRWSEEREQDKPTLIRKGGWVDVNAV